MIIRGHKRCTHFIITNLLKPSNIYYQVYILMIYCVSLNKLGSFSSKCISFRNMNTVEHFRRTPCPIIVLWDIHDVYINILKSNASIKWALLSDKTLMHILPCKQFSPFSIFLMYLLFKLTPNIYFFLIVQSVARSTFLSKNNVL